MPPVNIAIDATILTTLMGCEQLVDYNFNQNLSKKGGKSNALECGSLVHTFLEYYYAGLIKHKSKDDSINDGFAAAQLFIAGCPICKDLPIDFVGIPSCGHKLGDFIGVQNTPKKSGRQDLGRGMRDYIGYDHALDTCNQYLARWANDAWLPLETEVTKGEVIYSDDEIVILWKAKFDLIVDTLSQILSMDHKTMSQRRDTLSMNNQFMGQCVLMKSRAVLINKIGFQTSLKPQEKFERVMISYSKSRLDEWQNVVVPYWVKRLVKCIQTNTWNMNFVNCETKWGKCDKYEICESEPNMRQQVINVEFIKRRAWDVTND